MFNAMCAGEYDGGATFHHEFGDLMPSEEALRHAVGSPIRWSRDNLRDSASGRGPDTVPEQRRTATSIDWSQSLCVLGAGVSRGEA